MRSIERCELSLGDRTIRPSLRASLLRGLRKSYHHVCKLFTKESLHKDLDSNVDSYLSRS